MPADRKEQIRQLPSGKWQLRYYDRKGARHSGGVFLSRSTARQHYREEIEPALNGRPVARRDLTFSGLVGVFLERHAIVAKPRTIAELRWRPVSGRGGYRAASLGVAHLGDDWRLAGTAVERMDDSRRRRGPILEPHGRSGRRLPLRCVEH
jgi:hypothetical protein